MSNSIDSAAYCLMLFFLVLTLYLTFFAIPTIDQNVSYNVSLKNVSFVK